MVFKFIDFNAASKGIESISIRKVAPTKAIVVLFILRFGICPRAIQTSIIIIAAMLNMLFNCVI